MPFAIIEFYVDNYWRKSNRFSLCYLTDWSEEAVSSAEILRMIYQGRFLHGNVTLAGKDQFVAYIRLNQNKNNILQ